jgi:hypothetical protein
VKLWIVLLAAAVVIAAIYLEGWRQGRKLRKRGEKGGRGTSLLGVGLLELQSHLEPDRKVEVMQLEAKEKDRTHPEYRPAEGGDDREGGE